MIITALQELISRRTATGLAALGLLTATVGFMLLASTSSTTEAVLKGDIGSAWASPFDILVRPQGSAQPLETTQSLVAPNFLTASPTGITLQQLGAVRSIVGVDVAAPIAIVGVTELGLQSSAASVPVDLTAFISGTAPTAFRLEPTIIADGGHSRFALPSVNVVVALDGTYDIDARTLTVGKLVIPCTKVLCFGGMAVCTVPGTCSPLVVNGRQQVVGLDPGRPGAGLYFPVPITIAGIDPVAENKLSGIANCVTSGHYLEQATLPTRTDTVPVLLSDRTLLDESISVDISRTSALNPIVTGQGAEELTGWQAVATQMVNPNSALKGFEQSVAEQFPNLSPIWFPGPIQYSVGSDGSLVARTQPTDINAYQNPYAQGSSPELNVPVEATDTWFRTLQDRYQTGAGGVANQWSVAGQFDPTCIPGFSRIGSGQMATFVSPTVVAPDGTTMGPNRSIAGFLDSPPLMLTTLEGAEYFADPNRFKGGPGLKFISAIRVRVSNTATVGRPAEERLSRVAAQIRDATGLQVDIVKGSSPRSMQIELAPGQFGRPMLTVTQTWASKGVLFRFFQAVTVQNITIFASVLLAALVLVGQTAYVSVRRRRKEFAMLRALGWPPWRIAMLTEIEMAMLGGAVGIIGIAIGLPAAIVFHQGLTWWTTIGVVPLAIAMALLAGLVPALMVGRGPVFAGMSAPEPIRFRRLPGSAIVLGLRTSRTWRWDSVLGMTSLALGGTLLGVIELITVAFRSQLDTTLLGTYLSAQVRPFHFVVAALTLVIGALATAEVVTLTYLERRQEFGTLRAMGWPRKWVVDVLTGEAIGLLIPAAIAAAALTATCGLILLAPIGAILVSTVSAVAMTALAATLAVIAPLVLAYHSTASASLRGE